MKIRKRFWDASFYFVQLDTGKGDRVMGSSPGLVTGPSHMDEELWCCKYKWLVGWMEWVDNSIELLTVLISSR